jgi:hypothetical protein
MEDFLSPYEVEALVDELKEFEVEEYGSTK